MENDSYDDSQSDSGVSADFSPRSSMETQTTITMGSSTRLKYETPIEREIRRAIDREQSLRRSRGLPTPPSTNEYVEVPFKKNILPQSPTAKSERNPGKDRQFAGKKMQQEIHEEAQREQDLVKLGKVPGVYDKGTVRQLKEKKQLFEAFQEPKDPSTAVSTRSKTPFSGNERSTFFKQRGTSQGSTARGSYVERRDSVDMMRQTPSPNSPKGGRSTYCQNVIPENNVWVPSQKLYHTKPETVGLNEVDSGMPRVSTTVNGTYRITGREHEKEEEEAPKENPFFKLRPSTSVVKVERDIRETQEREKELRKQRISLYGGPCVGNGGGAGRPVSIDRNSPTWNEEALPNLPAPISRGRSGSTSVRQSLGKLGMWPPEQEQRSRPEVQVSPRTRRQKPPLLQRWETSLVKGHNEED
ncbi:uncharacterized protein misp3 [Genypterus blacodes]|uniref:uncharacterized protein misp3 n=1 Tax=Genypterus blacodes TaxID=154954 RepID=UPI003F765679